jgi:hypothetical protein
VEYDNERLITLTKIDELEVPPNKEAIWLVFTSFKNIRRISVLHIVAAFSIVNENNLSLSNSFIFNSSIFCTGATKT